MATAAAYLKSDTVRPPSKLLALSEFPRALFELGAYGLASSWLASAPKGDGHPVLVLPGFIAGDKSTARLRNFLTRTGYDAHAWELGRNFGPKAIGDEGERLIERLETIHALTGQKVSLVGWSLGGIMARLVARRAPDAVRQIITLGSPFAGDPRANNVWRIYEWLTGQPLDADQSRAQLHESAKKPKVPATAIYTHGDGIVAWRNCLGKASKRSENIRVWGSHCGLVVNPAALYVIADRLAQRDKEWQPFEYSGAMSWAYPAANDPN
jgi:pimeloyl-ACP methyl ester carboxylesterase